MSVILRVRKSGVGGKKSAVNIDYNDLMKPLVVKPLIKDLISLKSLEKRRKLK